MRTALATLAATLLLAVPAWAQGFKCPPAGTVLEMDTGGTVGSVTFKGADPSNPMLCVAQGSSGDVKRVANFYVSNSDDTLIGAKMAELISGRVAETSFTVTLRATDGRNFTYFDQWKAAGRERLQVGGRAIDAMVFTRRQNGQQGNSFSGDFKHWFDPATGLWLKREASVYRGSQVAPQMATAIKLP